MPEMVVPGPITEERSIREAVPIHTRKIFDSCKEEDIAGSNCFPKKITLKRPEPDVQVKVGGTGLFLLSVPDHINDGFQQGVAPCCI